MTSTDSSQMNFNPSWMQPAAAKGDRPNGLYCPPDDESAQEIMDPVFANHRYGREDILALMTRDVKPPDGLERCPFFVEKAQAPIILLALNETELRLQQNINSSKALSVLSRQDRNILNGSEQASPGNSNLKWVVAGGNRNFHSQNKPISNRWSALGSSSGSAHEGGIFRSNSNRGTGQSSFGRSAGLRMPSNNDQPPKSANSTNQRFRVPSSSNDSAFNDSSTFGNFSTEGQSPSTSNTHNPWTKVGVGKPADSDSRKGVKSSDNARMLLDDLGARGGQNPALGKENVENRQKYVPIHGQQHQQQKVLKKEENMQPTAQANVDKVLINSAPPSELPKADTKWHYLDPNGVQRGPFDGKQMQTWFDNGYFDSALRICKVGDKDYISLGELFQINGAVTPFISKTLPSSSEVIERNLNSNVIRKDVPHHNISQQSKHSPIIAEQASATATANIWNHISTSSNVPLFDNNIPPFLANADDISKTSLLFKTQQETDLQKILQEKQLAIAEEQRKLREKEELLLKEERERMERERRMREMELELQRRQEELQRIAREKEEELEKRRQQVTEYERQRREALEKMEEKFRNDQLQQLRQKEEERLRMEADARRKLDEREAEERRRADEQRRILDAEQRRREQEEANIRAAYEEARRFQEIAARRVEEEQRIALQAEQEARKRKQREEALVVAAEAQKKREMEERALAERLQREEEQERLRRLQMEEELSKVAIEALLSSSPPPIKAKVTPWVTVGNAKSGVKKEKAQPSAKAVENRGKTLLEIQQEEEDALREKLKRQQEMLEEHRRNAQVDSQNAPWTKSDTKSSTWGTPAFAPSSTTLKQGSSRSWNAVSAPLPAEIPKVPAKDNKKSQKKQQQKKAEIKLPKEKPKTPDAFTLWIIKRVRELNSAVDAEVFASFIEGVDSPDEAEDYIIGYLGESKTVKEFHREFLNKRIELRPRVLPTAKDDLSRPAVAAKDVFLSNSSTGPSNASGNGQSGDSGSNSAAKKKKKGKTQKVLDPRILGFRAAGDPNRINAGEIDTAPPAPANRRR